MSALGVEDMMAVLASHVTAAHMLPDTAHNIMTQGRTVRWHCSCGDGGDIRLGPAMMTDTTGRMRDDLNSTLIEASRRHVAQVLVAAVDLAARHGDDLDGDELAGGYMDRAIRILGAAKHLLNTERGPNDFRHGPTLAQWRIDDGLAAMMMRRRYLDVRESFDSVSYELCGIPVVPVKPEPPAVMLVLPLAESAAQALDADGRCVEAAEIRAAIVRATELDGDDLTFELVIS